MVGVPGKSKGCSTCRRRKKGCDQRRPVCGQCDSGGYECGGYQRERTFVVHPATKAVERALFVPYVKISTTRLLQSLDERQISVHCRNLFWDFYMPHGDCVVQDDLTLSWGHPMNWMEMINELPGNEPSLKNAFSALVISRVGKESRDLELAQASTQLYLQSLRDLQLAIRDPERIYSDEVLIASLLLGTYEIFEGSVLDSNNSWLSHAQGAARLIELRGPERHRAPQAHRAFLASRVATIFASILQPQATYLSAEEWRTCPWESQHRTYLDRLVDIATEIPGILERVNRLRCSCPKSTSFTRGALSAELVEIQKAINAWKRYIKKEAAAQDVRYNLTEDDDTYPFDTKIWFENHVFANATTLFHTFSLVIAEAAEELSEATVPAGRKVTDYASFFDADYHASCIARLVPYCLQPDMGGLGCYIINLPANLALRYFTRKGDSVIAAWLTNVLTGNKHYLLDRTILEVDHRQDNQHRAMWSPITRSESSDDISELSRMSTPTERRPSRVLVKFVYEDPSRHYNDTSENQQRAERLPIRSRRPP